jgi:hypothetical protein
MKKILFLVFMLIVGNFVFKTTCSAQPGADNGWSKNPLLNTWQYVGSPGISVGGAYNDDIVLAFSPTGQPYAAFTDTDNSGKVTVMKFDGTSWVTIGTPGSTITYYNISIAFSPSGQLYLAFSSDSNNTQKVIVMKYDGTDWLTVGTLGISFWEPWFIKLAFGPLGLPYLAFADLDGTGCWRAKVMKFNGTDWVYVGPPAISEGWAEFLNLAFSPSGQPYVAYIDNEQISVKKFDGTDWVYVGSPKFVWALPTVGLPLVINSSGDPYIAFGNFSAYKMSVMKFDGTNWVYVGTDGFSNPIYKNVTMTISPTDLLYAAFSDASNSDKATVMNYDGANWVNVGIAGFTPEYAGWKNLAIDPSGIPYLAFQDSAYLDKISVMKYDVASQGIQEKRNLSFSVYPNPVKDLLTLDLKTINSAGKQVEIYNVEGKMVYETQTYENKMILNVKNYSSGVYFIKLTTKTFSSLGKFCKE